MNPLAEALCATAAAPDRGGAMDLYGWLIGSWALDVTATRPDGSLRRRSGEWHFGWVLEGRAIQDVWIVPARSAPDRAAQISRDGLFYGSTLRTYDPRIDAWHIQWTDPVSQTYFSMIGRRRGEDIVQDGVIDGGTRIRWAFSDITPNSFLWTSDLSSDDGGTWNRNVSFRAHRTAS